jgi:beta-lactamase superfamily II metal-dependent hydrolase
MRPQKVSSRFILRVLLGLVIAGSVVLISACNFNHFPAVIGQTSTVAVPAQTDPATSAPITATSTDDHAKVSPCWAYFIDVREGDSELLVTPAGKTILIDGGEQQSGALAFLKAHQVSHIDLMIASHPHADHIGGLIDVLEAMKVDTVAVNGRSNNTQTFKHFLDLITSTGAGYEELSTGDAFSIDGVSFSVVAPDKEYAPDDLEIPHWSFWLSVTRPGFYIPGTWKRTKKAAYWPAKQTSRRTFSRLDITAPTHPPVTIS